MKVSSGSKVEKPTRGGRAPKHKGKVFERRICTELGIWYYGDAKALAPTRASGARAFSSKVEPGDIGLAKDQHDYFPLCVECKHHKKWKLEKVLSGKDLLLDAWDQLNAQLHSCDMATVRIPLVVIQGHFSDILCLFDQQLARQLHIDTDSLLVFEFKRNGLCFMITSLALLLNSDILDLKLFADDAVRILEQGKHV